VKPWNMPVFVPPPLLIGHVLQLQLIVVKDRQYILKQFSCDLIN
jgi:hypothetical protein